MQHTFINARTSKQTTIGGILAFLSIIIAQAQLYFDADPNTNVDWSVVAAAIGILYTALNARDADRTSEESK
jgi:hypothetical protein